MPTFDADAQKVYAMLDRLGIEEESFVETSSANTVSFVQPIKVEVSVTAAFPPGGEAVELLAIQ